jgi:hypothetical protein
VATPRFAPGGTAIRSLDLYVDDSEGAAGLLQVLYADVVPLPEQR